MFLFSVNPPDCIFPVFAFASSPTLVMCLPIRSSFTGTMMRKVWTGRQVSTCPGDERITCILSKDFYSSSFVGFLFFATIRRTIPATKIRV